MLRNFDDLVSISVNGWEIHIDDIRHSQYKVDFQTGITCLILKLHNGTALEASSDVNVIELITLEKEIKRTRL